MSGGMDVTNCPKCKGLEKCICRGTVDADFTPNLPNIQREQPDESLDTGPIPPPMTAKEFKQHCARVSKDTSKGMATRLAAFALGTATEMFLDAAGEVLGTGKKKLPAKKRTKR